MNTRSTTQSEIVRKWQVIDVKDQVLGRVATQIAHVLMGKSKAYFVRNLDCGDYVVVTNAKLVKVTGKKEKEKIYYRHSGYPSGLKGISFEQQLVKDPKKIIESAVSGMLPQNKLRATMLKRLFVFPSEEHTYTDKFVKAQEK